MKVRILRAVSMVAVGVVVLAITGAAFDVVEPGHWVRYKVMPASERVAPAVEYVTITIGAPERQEGVDLVWWQMAARKKDGGEFVVQALSQHAPMTTESGDVGLVFRYRFQQHGRPTLEYVDEATGLAYLPIFGFREALIPTPRSSQRTLSGFMNAGNYLGQALAVHGSGRGGKFADLGPITRILLNDDVLIGTARMFKDDGTGQDEDKEYRYVELTAEDYDEMIEAGFNLFMVNDKHADYVRERDVFFIKGSLGEEPYPELLYRSNYRGTAMFTDEPAARVDTSDCTSVHDAANLLRLRNYTYHLSPGSHVDGVVKMIEAAGFNVGDWYPRQLHIPVWETIYETAFYQMQGGAAGMIHEGRYRLEQYNPYLTSVLGPGAEVDARGMFELTYNFMRGAARCFGKEWGMAIYGQADYSIAPDAIRRAYDMGAHFIWYWTSDHDHHLPFSRQLELSRIMRAYQRDHPRTSRLGQLRAAQVAVAIPDGYMCGVGNQWKNPRFRYDKLNEYGVAYGDVNSQAYWYMYRLLKQGVEFDCVVDVPGVIENAGYDTIIRIGCDARTNLPNPTMPASPPHVSVKTTGPAEQYAPREGAPKAIAEYAKPGAIKIDGNLDDWAGAAWIDLKEKQVYDAAQAQWGGEDDVSARVAFAYDEQSIWIAARVVDDVLAGNGSGQFIWQNDCLQVAFDPLFNPHPDGYHARDDTEIGFSLVDGKPYAHRWGSRIAGAPGPLRGAEVAIMREGDVTCYEARVPFSELELLTPGFPGRSGMCAVVDDCDGDGRKGALAWTSGVADVKGPSTFGVLEFAGSEELKEAPPMAFAEAEKTVVSRGEDILFRLTAGARSACDGELTIKLRHNDAGTLPGAAAFGISAGMNQYQVRLDTSDLESDSYRAELVLKTGGTTALRQSLRVYVLP